MQGQEAHTHIRHMDDDTSIDTSDEDAYGHISKPMCLDGKPVMLFLAADDILAERICPSITVTAISLLPNG